MNSARKMASKYVSLRTYFELRDISKFIAEISVRVPPWSSEILHKFPIDSSLCCLEICEGTRKSGGKNPDFFSKKHEVRSRCGDLRISTPFCELSSFSKVSAQLETSLWRYLKNVFFVGNPYQTFW